MVNNAKARSNPQVHILLLGDNNLRRLEEDPKDYIKLVQTLVENFKNFTKCHLVLTSLLPSPATDHICKDVFKEISRSVKEIAYDTTLKVSFLNLEKSFISHGKIKTTLYESDEIHLNEQGAEVLASCILKHLELRPNKIWK